MKPRTSATRPVSLGIILAGLMMLTTASTLRAESEADLHPYLASTYSVDLGIFFPEREARFSADGTLPAESTGIDFGSQFGIKKHDDIFSLNFNWRYGKTWSLTGQYFASDTQKQRALQEDLDWRDVTFGAGTGVTAGTNLSLMRVFFGYRMASSDNTNWGFGLGLHRLEVGAFIEGNAIVDGVQAGYRRESVSAKAPLPNIGVWYAHSFSPKWAFRSRFDWMSADLGEYDGTLINASAGLNYAMFERVGFGLSYNLFKLEMGVDKADWRGDVSTSFNGIFVHVTGYW